MQLKYRFMILLALLCTGLGSGMYTLYRYEKAETALILDNIYRQRATLTEQIVGMIGSTTEKFVYEYAQWTEMVGFVESKEPDLEWAEINLSSASVVYETDTVWVLRLDGSIFYSHDFHTQDTAQPPPDALFPKLQTNKLAHFFANIGGELYEIHGGPITPSIGWEESEQIHGYLVAGRKWDSGLISKLSRVLASRVVLNPPDHPYPHASENPFQVHMHRALPGSDGQPVRLLDIVYESPELRQMADTDWWEALIFFLYGVLVIVAVMFFTYCWVLRPLGRISSSLSARDATPLTRMLGDKSELGRVAHLIQSAFKDREDLKTALEERARLGRDLHDGVIQTLYASGMSLATIQASVRHDPERAIAMLEQTRRELNATIKDVRNFITRLEPESEQSQKFEAALATLLDFMRGGLPVECTLDIGADIDSDLPMDIRAHLLQIVREAGSNAFRHSGCTRFHVSLHKTDTGELDFSATDNGRGFDPDQVVNPGQGLRNFRERAAELGAKLDIKSAPGQGVIVQLRIPL